MHHYWFGDVEGSSCHPVDRDLGVLDRRLDQLAIDFRGFVPLEWNLAIACGVVRDRAEYLSLLRQLCLVRAERGMREALLEKDQEIIRMIRMLHETDAAINGLWERITDWYTLTHPDVTMVRESRDDRRVLAEMRQHPDPTLRASIEAVDMLLSLRKDLSRQISHRAELLLPNCSALIGGLVAARLVARAGGLQALARMPSATLQVLGAESALFSHLRDGTPPPKHGIIFQHKRVHSAPQRLRGRVARVLAGRLAIAAKLDAARGEAVPGFLDDAQGRINRAGGDRAPY